MLVTTTATPLLFIEVVAEEVALSDTVGLREEEEEVSVIFCLLFGFCSLGLREEEEAAKEEDTGDEADEEEEDQSLVTSLFREDVFMVFFYLSIVEGVCRWMMREGVRRMRVYDRR